MIGAVGDDSSGQELLCSLQRAGVDTSCVDVIPQMTTGQAFITVDSDGQNSIVLIAGANVRVTKSCIDRHIDAIRKADIVVLQLEIPLDTVSYVKEIAKSLGKTVIVDPAPAVLGIPVSFWKGIDYIKPNETEAEILTGIHCACPDDAFHAADVLLRNGVRNVLISLGDQGCAWGSQSGCEFFRAEKVQAVDTTAAGDCFTGAFAKMLSEDKTVQEAILFAQRAAAISVTRRGAQTSMPGMEDIPMMGEQI